MQKGVKIKSIWFWSDLQHFTCSSFLVCEADKSLYNSNLDFFAAFQENWLNATPRCKTGVYGNYKCEPAIPKHLCCIRFQRVHIALPSRRCPMHLIQPSCIKPTQQYIVFQVLWSTSRVTVWGAHNGNTPAWFIRLMCFASNLLQDVFHARY